MTQSTAISSAASLDSREFVHVYPPTRVRFERGGAAALGSTLARLNVTSALLVTGPNVAANGPLITSIQQGAGGRIGPWFADMTAHAPIDAVDAAATLFRDSGADGLISVGGGSVHDAARQIGLVLATGLSPRAHFADAAEAVASGHALYKQFGAQALDVPPMVAVPSTFSGAEATNGGAVTDRTEKRKYVLMADALYFDELVYDPMVYESTPRPLLLSTGMNAINHAVMRLLSPSLQPIAEPQFVAALQLMVTALPRLVEIDPTDQKALSSAIVGAHMSESINVRSGISHALVHQLGARYDLGHGILNGIVLPGSVEWIGAALPDDVRRVQAAVAASVPDLDSDADLWLPAFLRDLLNRLGLPVRLRDVNVPQAELESLADDVMRDVSTPTSARPVTNRAEVVDLLKACW
jgi:alcohol dehydrogenase class IV